MSEAPADQSAAAIVKTITLKADLSRVWNAIINPAEFAHWFGVEFGGPFIPPDDRQVDPQHRVIAGVAVTQQPFRGTPVDLVIGDIEPMRLFSFQ